MKLEHTKLPYARNDLEPSMSKETIDYHYDELYGGYVTRFNKNEGDSDFNEAGAFLHNIYFTQFQSPSSGNNPTGPIAELINEHFKSFSNFKEEFEKVAMGIQGSGWVYLSKDGKIKTIVNHAIKKDIVLLIDWWEHAWALDYQADKKGYLASQWKIINWNAISAKIGLAESRMSLNFIKELHEARIIQNEADVKITFKEACESVYLCVLALEFLSRLKKGQDAAVNYARQTAQYSGYTEFRSSATDLHNFIFFVTAPASRVETIFNSSQAKLARERTFLPVTALNGWLHSLPGNSGRGDYFYMQLEQALSIENYEYKEIRRMLSYRDPLDSDIQQLAYRILNSFRNKLPNFDLLPILVQHLQNPQSYNREK
jgi:Fe-Mn family superoxide dismutase